MPPLEWGAHLVNVLFDMGPCSYTGFGPVPLSEVEIAAWQFNRGMRLEPWECETIRRLSREYVSMSQEAESQSCPSPYSAAFSKEQVVKMEDAFLTQLAAVARKPTTSGKGK